MDSLPSLIQTMRSACSPTTTIAPEKPGECLVAAKVLYFGVGGGVSDFIDYITKNGIGKARVVKEHNIGVGRVIMSLEFY
jgi:protein-histidine N-methyltransferase